MEPLACDEGGRSRAWLPWALAAAALLALRMAAHHLPAGELRSLLANLAEWLQAAVAAAACWWAARQQQAAGGNHLPWRLLAVAYVAWAVGDGLFLLFGLTGWGQQVGLPDLFYLLYYPLFLAAVLLLPRRRPRPGERRTLALDAAIIITGTATVLWESLVRPALAGGGHEGGFAIALALAYPVGDLLGLWGVLALLVSRRDPGGTEVCRWLALAMAVMIVIDLIYGRQLLAGTYEEDNWLGMGWAAANGLAVVAAARRGALPAGPLPVAAGQRHPIVGPLLVGWVALAAAWVAVALGGAGRPDGLGSLGMSATLLLVLARLLAGALANHRLYVRLNRANTGLEERVRARTAELGEANASLRAEIVERRQAEELARLGEERFRHLFDASPVGLGLYDGEGILHAANPRLLELAGAQGDEVEAGLLSWRRLTPPAWIEADLAAAQAIARDGRCDPYEKELVSLDGRTVPVLVSAVRLKHQGGSLVCAAVVDLTERRRLEADLERARRLEALGTVAGGVAHDFNNLLTVVIGHSELLLSGMPDGSQRRGLSAAHDAAQRASELARQLLTFARLGRQDTEEVDLVARIHRAGDLLRRLAGPAVAIEYDLPACPVRLRAVPSELDQVLMNLVVNARDAMPEGGRIQVAVQIEQAGSGSAVRVRLEVRDTGEGMDAATRARCLEPFFTTKGPGRGTGLGLAIVQRVVQGLGGVIRIESEPGRGSGFIITLPMS
ncbi:MAG: ATP-binding protein [Planctomycetes bacterium]|nr:ATP-binding protein [Planctomycetota bacterium]